MRRREREKRLVCSALDYHILPLIGVRKVGEVKVTEGINERHLKVEVVARRLVALHCPPGHVLLRIRPRVK